MLLLLADGRNFPPYVILNHQNVPKGQLHRVPFIRCQRKVWMGGLVVGGVEHRAGNGSLWYI
jgi:hypothetical protein